MLRSSGWVTSNRKDVGPRARLPTARSSFGEPTESTEGRHRTISPMGDEALISPRSRLSLWLDWYCSSPWRALLAWAVALTLAFILGELELFSRAYATAGTLEQYLGGRLPF